MKKLYYNLPDYARVIIVFVGAYVLYKIYKGIADKIKENARRKKLIEAYGNGSGYLDVNGQALNLRGSALTLWGLCFDGFTEDETAIIELVNSIPNNLFREFNINYLEVLTMQKDSYHWYNSYKGSNLQNDLTYFLGNRISEVSAKFNYL
ncbi:MAG: hypothetical protein JST62_01075 [Bacteroidetes bacterium]|nr:hypothetical protein [Bacteroidota bacterium]